MQSHENPLKEKHNTRRKSMNFSLIFSFLQRLSSTFDGIKYGGFESAK